MKRKSVLKILNKRRKALFFVIFLAFFASVSHREILAAGKVTLSAVPAAQSVTVGQSADYTIKINRDGFDDKVTLSVSTLPAGVTANFAPNSTAGKSSLLTLKTANNTPAGIFSITVKAAADGIAIAPIVVKLETKPAATASARVFPQAQSIVAGQETSFEIVLDRLNYDGALQLRAENVPEGVTLKFDPPETSGNSTRMILYSNGLPHLPAEFGMNVVVTARELPYFKFLTPVRLRVNCDIAWVEQFGVPNNNIQRPDFPADIAYDNAGNVYVTGSTHVPFSDGAFGGNFDGWLAKYSPDGRKLWLVDVDLAQRQSVENHATTVAVDNAGNVYVAGYTKTVANISDFDAFIAKFDAQGNQLDHEVFGMNRLEDGSKKMDLRFDAMGRPVLTTALAIRRGELFLPAGRFEIANFDVARIIFDANLNPVSGLSTPIIRNVFGEPSAVAVGSDGSIYAAGTDLDQAAGRYFAWVRKYNSVGSRVWNLEYQLLAGGIAETPVHLEADGNGNVFVAGNSVSTSNSGMQLSDAWVAKHDASGARQWKHSISTPDDDFVSSLVVDNAGDIFLSGATKGNLAAVNPDRSVQTDAWLEKRAQGDGGLIFIRQFAVSNKDEFSALTVDGGGNLFLTGNTAAFKNVNYGYEDALVMRFTPGSSMPFLLPSITAVTPQMIQSGNQFIVTGNNLAYTDGVFFNGRSLPFAIVSQNQINATAPAVSSAATAPVTISSGCKVYNSPTNLTVNP